MSHDKGLKKAKRGGGGKLTHTFKIWVSGAYLKGVFAARKAANKDLRLFANEGPFSLPFFFGLVSKARKDAIAAEKQRCTTSKPEDLEQERDKELERVSIAGAKLVASAEVTLRAPAARARCARIFLFFFFFRSPYFPLLLFLFLLVSKYQYSK